MSLPSPNLDNVRWKLARAKEQLDALRQDITPYMDDPPYRIVTETNADPNAPPGAKALVIRIDRDPPEADWAGRIGEIAYNARSALDQLVVQLVHASGNTPRKGSRTQYPIFRHERDYLDKSQGARQSRRDRMLEGVRSRFRRLIDDSQPYHRARSAERDPLAILDTISNRDKHREAHPCLVLMEMFSVVITQPGGEKMTVTVTDADNANTARALRDGSQIVSVAPSDPNAELKVGDDFTLRIAFETDTEVITLDDLERVLTKVSEIVARAEREIARQRP